jgi:hypothetical protein
MEWTPDCGTVAGVLDIGPHLARSDAATKEELSTEPGMTFTHRHVYRVTLMEGTLTAFLTKIDPFFNVIDIMSATVVLVQSRFIQIHMTEILNHCVVRGPTPNMHTVHENFVHPSELWHLSDPDDNVTIQTINCHLEKCGAIEVVLVTSFRPSGVLLPSVATIRQRYDVWLPVAAPSDAVDELVPDVEQIKL